MLVKGAPRIYSLGGKTFYQIPWSLASLAPRQQCCRDACYTWWRHQLETFSVLLAICAGNSAVTGEFPTQRPVTRSFDVFFDLRLNKRLNKQCWGWWFETPSRPLWRHCNACILQSERTTMGPYIAVSRHNEILCLWIETENSNEVKHHYVFFMASKTRVGVSPI